MCVTGLQRETLRGKYARPSGVGSTSRSASSGGTFLRYVRVCLCVCFPLYFFAGGRDVTEFVGVYVCLHHGQMPLYEGWVILLFYAAITL